MANIMGALSPYLMHQGLMVKLREGIGGIEVQHIFPELHTENDPCTRYEVSRKVQGIYEEMGLYCSAEAKTQTIPVRGTLVTLSFSCEHANLIRSIADDLSVNYSTVQLAQDRDNVMPFPQRGRKAHGHVPRMP